MFKPVTEKQFKMEVVAYLFTLGLACPILILEWFQLSQWYARCYLLAFIGLSLYLIITLARVLCDKKYARKKFIARNDERNLEIQDKCLRNVAVVSFMMAGASFGFLTGFSVFQLEVMMVNLLPIVVGLSSLILAVYGFSWLYYHFTL